MKFNVGIFFATAAFTLVFSADVASDAADECGSLGVMSLDNLPAGVDPANVRKCADHPFGNNRPMEGTSLAPLDDTNVTSADAHKLDARSCKIDRVSSWGCTDGYCWKICDGGGRWCWTATNFGIGPLKTCSSHSDCGNIYYCGQNCACGNNCGSCACGC